MQRRGAARERGGVADPDDARRSRARTRRRGGRPGRSSSSRRRRAGARVRSGRRRGARGRCGSREGGRGQRARRDPRRSATVHGPCRGVALAHPAHGRRPDPTALLCRHAFGRSGTRRSLSGQAARRPRHARPRGGSGPGRRRRVRGGGPTHLARPGVLPPGAHRAPRGAVRGVEVPDHGHRGQPDHPGPRSDHLGGPLAAAPLARRAAPADQRGQRDDERRRAATDPALPGGALHRSPAGTAGGAARPHRPGPDPRPQRPARGTSGSSTTSSTSGPSRCARTSPSSSGRCGWC